MALTEGMKRWNQRVEEEMKKGSDSDYLENYPKIVQDLYEELKEQVLKLFPSTQIMKKKNYLSFKSKTNFLDVQLQQKALKCIINVKKGVLKDSNKLTRDISEKGHFGAGDYEFLINSMNDIERVMDLIVQSHKTNS